jgi:hypothetical protein
VRRGGRVPALAGCLLELGFAATLAANVAHGLGMVRSAQRSVRAPRSRLSARTDPMRPRRYPRKANSTAASARTHRRAANPPFSPPFFLPGILGSDQRDAEAWHTACMADQRKDGNMPEDDDLDESVEDELFDDDDIQDMLGDAGKRLVEQISSSISLGFQYPRIDIASLFPSTRLVNSFVPQLNLMSPSMEALSRRAAKSITGSLAGPMNVFLERQHRQWAPFFESLRKAIKSWLPPNWQDVNLPSSHLIETILLDEGIPLAWVPSPEVLTAILEAPDAAVRRRIIGRRWRRIVSDCEACLAEVTNTDLKPHCVFATDIARALREGHAAAAQALAANLLDSIIRHNVDLQLKQTVTATGKKRVRIDIDDYQLKAGFAMAPIWRAYEEFWEKNGDPVPRFFGRHPSAHAVSRAQYSRVNAVIGLMLVTSLLRLLDEGIGDNKFT